MYPARVICQLLDLPRSTYYYRPQDKDEQNLEAAIEEVAQQWPTYGYRRVVHQLHRERGWVINHKRVRRLMTKMGLQARKTRKKQRTTDSEHGFPRFPNLVLGLEVVRPDEVWVADLTYVRLQQEFVYLAIIMDVFTRCIRGWHLERHLGQELTLTALRCAPLDHVPEIHHSDQGVQYAATAYVDLLHDYGIAISMTDRGQAWQNGYAERVIRTIKEAEVELSDYQDYYDAYDQIGRFLDDVVMHKRIHSSLGYLTPAEFESQWLARQDVAELCS